MRSLFLVSMSMVLVLSGCTCQSEVIISCDAGGCSGDGGSGSASRDGGNEGTFDAGPSPFDVLALELTPATAALTPKPGERLTQTFVAYFVQRDGAKRVASGVMFMPSTLTAGDLDPGTGIFTTNGAAGAAVTVTARSGSLTAAATLTVTVQSVTAGTGTGANAGSKFLDVKPASAASANIVYPLDNVVMPQNLFPVDVQWLEGVQGDVFRVSLRKTNVSVTTYLLHSGAAFGNHLTIDPQEWKSLIQTNPDESVTLTVDRWVAASSMAVASAQVHLTFAKGALNGSVYFWSVSEARVFRVDDGTNLRVNFMPKPPQTDSEQCVGCHSVSPSGRYMVGRLGGGRNFGTVFDLTTDLTGDPPPSLFAPNQTQFWFSTWNPAETRLMVSQSYSSSSARTGLVLLDPRTGAVVPATPMALPLDATHPAWAPDNSAVAFVSNADDWGHEFQHGNLSILPVTGADRFGAASTILEGANVPQRPADQQSISYPVWSPDSKRIAFALGRTGASTGQPGQLYIVDKNGSNTVKLAKANGGLQLNFEPRFSPFDSGGYYWLAFLSRRDYGNASVGSKGTDHAQIWVTAIKKNPAPGEDPSEAGYWLPGQSPQSRNISAYWAPKACRATGVDCSVGGQCCSGDCRPPAQGGAAVCSPPPPDRCRTEGQTCSATGDCCTSLACDQGTCTVSIN